MFSLRTPACRVCRCARPEATDEAPVSMCEAVSPDTRTLFGGPPTRPDSFPRVCAPLGLTLSVPDLLSIGARTRGHGLKPVCCNYGDNRTSSDFFQKCFFFFFNSNSLHFPISFNINTNGIPENRNSVSCLGPQKPWPIHRREYAPFHDISDTTGRALKLNTAKTWDTSTPVQCLCMVSLFVNKRWC